VQDALQELSAALAALLRLQELGLHLGYESQRDPPHLLSVDIDNMHAQRVRQYGAAAAEYGGVRVEMHPQYARAPLHRAVNAGTLLLVHLTVPGPPK